MFSVYCKHCGTVVLLDSANVHSIHNTSTGIVLYFRCHAGHSGIWLTGKGSLDHGPGADGRGISGDAAAPSLASPTRTSSGHRSWWSRAPGRRSSLSCPAASPRCGELRAG